MRWVPLLALLAACPDGGDDGNGDTDEDGQGCPTGMVPAGEAGLTLFNFAYNGLTLQAAFEEDARVMGRPTACITSDGRLADLVFEVADEPYGRIVLGADRTGSFDLNGTEGDLEIEIFDGSTFELGEWQSGTWFVESLSPISSDVLGSALEQDGDRLEIQFTLEASR